MYLSFSLDKDLLILLLNFSMYSSWSFLFSINFFDISLYVSGSVYFQPRSSNSVFILYNPILCARGA